MEAHTSSNSVEADPKIVSELIEFGFGPEETVLALKIAQNDKEQAVEILCSGGADLETL